MASFNDTLLSDTLFNDTLFNNTLLVALNVTTSPDLFPEAASPLVFQLVVALVGFLFQVAVAVLEMAFLSILLLAIHYYAEPSDFHFIYKPKTIVPCSQRKFSDPEGLYRGFTLLTAMIEVSDLTLDLTEFALMLPLLAAFLLVHLLIGVTLWCYLPTYLRPVKLVVKTLEIAFSSDRTWWSLRFAGVKAFLAQALLAVIRSERGLRYCIRHEAVELLKIKLRQVGVSFAARIPETILDFLVKFDWDEQYERLMAVIANTARYFLFEFLPVAACVDFQHFAATTEW